MRYNWQHQKWPDFSYELDGVVRELMAFQHNSGRLEGTYDALSEEGRVQTVLDLLLSEAIKTSAIEGEFLSRHDVASSLKRNLGLEEVSVSRDARAKGVATLMTDSRETFALPLSEQMLFDWHKALLEHDGRVVTGAWRAHTEPMQIVSGALGFERVHFEAPPSDAVPEEMLRFIDWFNATAPGGTKEMLHAPVRAAVTHVYFESVHPFEDGNGRIGRALAEKALAQTSGRPELLSLSAAIEQDKNTYYRELERAQRDLDITEWVEYFVRTVILAQDLAQKTVEFTLNKSRLLDRVGANLNPAQTKVLHRMLAAGPTGFDGGMTAEKYTRIARVSKATATRHLQDFVQRGILEPTGKGRASRYQIRW